MPLHRNQKQIRSGLYLKLGLIPNTPQAHPRVRRVAQQEQDDSASSPRSCLRKRTSVLHKKREQSVQFEDMVTVTMIPSHVDLDDESWNAIWNSRDDARAERERNRFEFWADGGDWQSAPEEDAMIPYEGLFIHPATWARLEAYQAQEDYNYQYYIQPKLPSYRSNIKRRSHHGTAPIKENRGNGYAQAYAGETSGSAQPQDYPYVPHWKDSRTY